MKALRWNCSWLLLGALLAGCPESSESGEDPCDGLILCTRAGVFCDGGSLVTCQENADGCLAESRENCTQLGQEGFCDAAANPPRCSLPTDPCAGLTLCDQPGVTCQGTDRVTCGANADGCLVESRQDCTALGQGGLCDANQSPPACVLPDPCAGLTLCQAAGVSCAGPELVTCAQDANGCLVESRQDCAALGQGGLCDANQNPPACVLPDPCAGLNLCQAAGVSCEGPELVTCAQDANGCLVESRQDCAALGQGGLCDANQNPPACALPDPCAGLPLCQAAGVACAGAEIVTCARNEDGCLVESRADCSQVQPDAICSLSGGEAFCTAESGPCAGLVLCVQPGAACQGDDLLSCAENGDGCLIETLTDCAAQGTGLVCEDRIEPAACIAPPGTDLDTLLQEISTEVCEALFRCCFERHREVYFSQFLGRPRLQAAGLTDRLPPNAELGAAECPALLEEIFAIEPFGPWIAEAQSGNVSFHPLESRECLETLRYAGCGQPVWDALWDSTCFGFQAPEGGASRRRAFSRYQGVGEECVPMTDGQGAGAYGTCDPEVAWCCRPDAQDPTACALRADMPGVCAPAGGAGDTCRMFGQDLALCRTGLYCEVAGMGPDGTCQAEPDYPPLAEGDLCFEGFEFLGECQGSYCDAFGTDHCEPLKELGAACQGGYECQSWACDQVCIEAFCDGSDPCAELTQCEAEGVTCDGDTLVTCAANPDGCLVEARVDCTQRSQQARCDDTLDPARCVDPCAGLIPCQEPGASCEDETLVVCAENPDGCLFETREDCTAADPDGTCDDTASPPVCQLPPDPCDGISNCAEEGLSCAGDVLVDCVPDAQGCLVAQETDCSADGMVCDPATEPATCAAERLCAAAIPLSCASPGFSGDTAQGTRLFDTYTCGNPYLTYPGNEVIFVFSNPETARVTVTTRKTSSSYRTFPLFVLKGTGSACLPGLACRVDPTEGYSQEDSLTFDVAAGEALYLVYDLAGNYLIDDTTTFELEVACQYPVCGNGSLDPGEGCDDDNLRAGDGCSRDCQQEEGFVCQNPPGQTSSCRRIVCGDGLIDAPETCDDERPEAGDGCSADCQVEPGYHCAFAPSVCLEGGETSAEPIPLAEGTLRFSTEGYANDYGLYGGQCGVGSIEHSAPDLVFSLSLPPGHLLRARFDEAQTFSGAKLFVVSDAADPAGSCLRSRAGQATYYNSGAEPLDLLLIVDAWGAQESGAFTLDLAYLPAAELQPGEVCANAIQLDLSGGSASVSGSTAGHYDASDSYGGACIDEYNFRRSGAGPDQVYAVRVPAGNSLSVGTEADFDDVIAVAQACSDLVEACVYYQDNTAMGLAVVNETGSDWDYYIVVDGFFATDSGSYTLNVVVAP